MSLKITGVVLNCLRLSVLTSMFMSISSYRLFDSLSDHPSSLECHLVSTFESLLELQNSREQFTGTPTLGNQLVVSIQEERTKGLAAKFHNSISQIFTTSLLLNIVVNRKHDEGNVYQTLRILDNYQNQIYALVLVADDMSLVTAVMSAVCSHASFKWTRLLHVTEWMIAVTNSGSVDMFKKINNCIDYISVIMTTSAGLALARKSRGKVLHLSRNVRSFWSVEDLRAGFEDFRSAKKSGLEMMHLHVAVLNSSKKNDDGRDEFVTRYERFAVGLAEILASTLNFTFSLVAPQDKLYGYVNADQSATGITGLLVRREAAFSSIGMSKTANRLQAIDFTDTLILYEPLQVTYRLTANQDIIDVSLIDIVQPSFYLLLLGPVLILVALGLVTHVLTNGCTEATPTFSKQRMRTLTSFPDHICFHVDTISAGQTGRVLKGSWSVFWLVFSAAVSAFFVTSFTVTSAQLKIDTLDKLLYTRRYSLGVLGSNSALLDTLRTSDDWVQVALWQRISTANTSDPSVLSTNYTEHVSRVLSANYVFLHHFGVLDMPLFVEADYSNVRSHLIHSLDALAGEFLAIPKNVFFKDQLNNLVTTLGETGILRYLGLKYKIYQKESKRKSALECHCPVVMSRILILVYVTLCNLAICWFCLMAEIFYDKMTKSSDRRHGRKLQTHPSVRQEIQNIK